MIAEKRKAVLLDDLNAILKLRDFGHGVKYCLPQASDRGPIALHSVPSAAPPKAQATGLPSEGGDFVEDYHSGRAVA